MTAPQKPQDDLSVLLDALLASLPGHTVQFTADHLLQVMRKAYSSLVVAIGMGMYGLLTTPPTEQQKDKVLNEFVFENEKKLFKLKFNL